jgi:hypothetical protein
MEHLTLKAASAYQAASRRRVPPPAFGPLSTSDKDKTARPTTVSQRN